MASDIVITRGGGDIGSGVIQKLYRAGFSVLVLELASPLMIRRAVAFAPAVINGETVIEGIRAVKAETIQAIRNIWDQGNIPVMVDPEGIMVKELCPLAVVDVTLAKRNTGMHRAMAPITIALGPGFRAGEDVDVVIETNRGHNLGRLIFSGCAEPDTGIPAPVDGYGAERVLRAPRDGTVRHALDIGAHVRKGETVCYTDGEPLSAPLNGVIRGLVMNGRTVTKGSKIGDIDPRGREDYCFTISDKARAIGGAVLEAILYLKRVKGLL